MAMIGKLSVNLVVSSPPLDGLRWRIGMNVLALIVRVFGIKLVVGIEPEFVVGTLEPVTTY